MPRKRKKKKKPNLGRIPIPKPGSYHKDKKKYNRKNKHKSEELDMKKNEEIISKVSVICNAYESGYGHGYQGDGLPNPFPTESDLHEAYGYGYVQGVENRKEMLECERKGLLN